MPKQETRVKSKRSATTWEAPAPKFEIPAFDIQQWLRNRQTLGTWQLVSLFSWQYSRPPEKPTAPLAQRYDQAYRTPGEELFERVPEGLDTVDYLEAILRDAIVGGELKGNPYGDGHYLVKTEDGLRFVLRHIEAINKRVSDYGKRLPEEVQNSYQSLKIPEGILESLEDLRRENTTEISCTPPPNEMPANEIIEHDSAFAIRYEGQEVSVKKSLGWRYICELLRTPNNPIDPLELYRSVRKPKEGESRAALEEQYDDADQNQTGYSDRAESYDLGDRTVQNQIEGLDAEITQCGQELRDAVEIAGQQGDKSDVLRLSAKVETLMAKKKALQKEYTRPGGKPRRVKGDNEKALDTISQSVRRELSQLTTACPCLCQHLTESLELKNPLRYLPAEDQHWRFE